MIGLPGNPASTLVTFGLLTRPYLLRRLGVDKVAPLGFPVPAGFTWSKPGNRREYLRARLENGRAVIYRNQSSGVLRSAAWAEGLVEVLEGTTLAEGDALRFIPLSELRLNPAARTSARVAGSTEARVTSAVCCRVRQASNVGRLQPDSSTRPLLRISPTVHADRCTCRVRINPVA